MATRPDIRIPVTAFKAQCLAAIDDIARGKANRIVLTKRGKPVAALVPFGDDPPALWGALRGTVTIPDGVDVTAPVGDQWEAAADNNGGDR